MLSNYEENKLIKLILADGLKTSNPEILALCDKFNESPKPINLRTKLRRDFSNFVDSNETEYKVMLQCVCHNFERDTIALFGYGVITTKVNTELAYALNELVHMRSTLVGAVGDVDDLIVISNSDFIKGVLS